LPDARLSTGKKQKKGMSVVYMLSARIGFVPKNLRRMLAKVVSEKNMEYEAKHTQFVRQMNGSPYRRQA
jgi:hypothetical protein